MNQVTFVVEPSGPLRGEWSIPGDKSISHRAIMFGALADGTTEIDGFLTGEDCLATLHAFTALGVPIQQQPGGRVVVSGVGVDGLTAPAQPLDMGNAGTAMRLMAGLLAGQPFASVLVGDASLSGRPMRRVTYPLAQMGAQIKTTDAGTAPLQISGGQPLTGIDYVTPMASAQVKSSLLLAGLYANGTTRIREPAPTRDHTERMLSAFGYPLTVTPLEVALSGGGRLRATHIQVPGDISSAAFFLVGAAIAPGSDLVLEGVGVNPTRIGVIDILRAMGGDIELLNRRQQGGEPVADLRVRHAALKGIVIPEHLVPLAIDEFPALFVAAAAAEGETVLTGARELRVKESDRIQTMADGLQALGIAATPTPDGMVITGCGGARWGGGRVDSHGDHRIAMALAMAALLADAPITIDNCANVATSFPGFTDLARSAGLAVTVAKGA